VLPSILGLVTTSEEMLIYLQKTIRRIKAGLQKLELKVLSILLRTICEKPSMSIGDAREPEVNHALHSYHVHISSGKRIRISGCDVIIAPVFFDQPLHQTGHTLTCDNLSQIAWIVDDASTLRNIMGKDPVHELPQVVQRLKHRGLITRVTNVHQSSTCFLAAILWNWPFVADTACINVFLDLRRSSCLCGLKRGGGRCCESRKWYG
jgi:hypothetical protein